MLKTRLFIRNMFDIVKLKIDINHIEYKRLVRDFVRVHHKEWNFRFFSKTSGVTKLTPWISLIEFLSGYQIFF